VVHNRPAVAFVCRSLHDTIALLRREKSDLAAELQAARKDFSDRIAALNEEVWMAT
jgi:hypothetical protein